MKIKGGKLCDGDGVLWESFTPRLVAVKSWAGLNSVDSMRKAAELLGFIHKGGQGSHRSYARTGEPVGLNFQNRGGNVPPYQARQLVAMMDKYEAIP